MKLITVDDVAKILCVSEKTVYRLIWSGTLKAAKIGGQWRIDVEWVDEYVERQLNKSVHKGGNYGSSS